jgi:hypothetical protein
MGERDAATGQVKGLLPIGNVPELTLDITEETEEHKESWSGNRAVDELLTTSIKVAVTITFESFSPENMALGTRGAVAKTAAKTDAVAEVGKFIVTGATKGAWYPLNKTNLDSGSGGVTVTATQSVGGSAISSLVLGTDYNINYQGGLIQIIAGGKLDVDGAEVTVNAKYAAQTNMEALMNANPERYFLFDGLNTKDQKNIRLEIYRLRVAPFAGLGKINDGTAQAQITADALVDSTITGNLRSKVYREITQD